MILLYNYVKNSLQKRVESRNGDGVDNDSDGSCGPISQRSLKKIKQADD